MSIIHKCDNCNKEYTSDQYTNLEVVYVSDRSSKLVALTRRCNACGSEFKIRNTNFTLQMVEHKTYKVQGTK